MNASNKKTPDTAESTFSVKTAVEQIEKTRDVDAETSKPRLQAKTSPKDSTEKTKSSKSKPSTESKTTELHKVLEIYLNYPLQAVRQPTTSKFVPCAFSMYYIVHLMDDAMRKNTYFLRQEDAWHPFISRLYFGIAFFIQTLRAEVESGISSDSHRAFYEDFIRTYPLEEFPIPGPLVTLFEALAPARPSSTIETTVTPFIPDILGPQRASILIDYDAAHASQLILPNIPMLIGFANTITTAAPGQIPDYSARATFDNTAGRNLNGHMFNNNAWTPVERAALLTPGLLYPAETDQTVNDHFHLYGARIGLPVINANDDIRPVDRFLYLHEDNTWFGAILTIMTAYCEYYKESMTLASIKTRDSVSPLLTTLYPVPSSNTVQTNPLTTLTHAFPRIGAFTLVAQHYTTERELPPASTMLAECAALNCMFPAPNYGPWNNVGDLDVTRSGPYWLKSPPKGASTLEDTYKGLGALIKRYYLVAKPIDSSK